MAIIDEKTSNDILRIDLNTIKTMGCDISRSSPKTDHKYVLSKHPFEFKITLYAPDRGRGSFFNSYRG